MKKVLLLYLKPYSKQIILVVGLVIIQTFANLYLPNLNAEIINNGVAKGDTGYIMRNGGYMLIVSLVLMAASILAVYWGSKTAMSFGRDVRSALFRKVGSFSQPEINKFGTPSLINRNTNDVQHVQMMVAIGLTVMLGAPLMMIGGVIMALRQDIPLTASLAVIIPLMAVVLGYIGAKAIPLFRSLQVKLDRINQIMRENLTGIRVIRAFARVQHEQKRFDEANRDLTRTALRVQRLFAVMMPALFAIFNFSTLAIWYFGGWRVADGNMPFGNLTAFITYVMQILISVLMAAMLAMIIPRAAACGDRIQAVLDTEPAIRDPEQPVLLPELNGGSRGRVVEFKEVEFRYPGALEPVLRDISFAANPWQTTAIVGSTGSGKSTLISLIPRFYDVTSGALEIDGVDVRKFNREDLWKLIGFVPQKAFLFSGTVATNLRFGAPEASDEELWRALSIAQAKDFVEEMGGLDAPIEQGGANVSGGQRQRLAIARALVKRAPIYIFDDCFSALDFRTDSLLRAALKQEVADATVFIVAQRVSTVLHAEQILVLDNGAIVGKGTHQELLTCCETYREIVYSQISEEEAA